MNEAKKIKVQGFDPAINYGPNDAGISAVTIAFGILGVLATTWLFQKIYEQVSKLFDTNKNSDS